MPLSMGIASIRWTKAHSEPTHLLTGAATPIVCYGNDTADGFAGEAALPAAASAAAAAAYLGQVQLAEAVQLRRIAITKVIQSGVQKKVVPTSPPPPKAPWWCFGPGPRTAPRSPEGGG